MKIFFQAIILIFCISQVSFSQTKLSPDEFDKKMKLEGIQLVDVRTPSEYKQGFLDNAININFQAPDFQEKISNLNKEKPVLLYCAAGGRSGKASIMLQSMGFKEIYDLEGGINAWKVARKLIKL